MTTGLDAFIHSYPLAVTDTTETISEFMVMTSVEGHSARRVRHRWRVLGEASTGSELNRGRLFASYGFQDAGQATRFRLDGQFWTRQYRDKTQYTLSSDNWEGRLDARLCPWVGSNAQLELRVLGAVQDYQTPSTLEVDYQDLGAGVFVRSQGLGESVWSVGVRSVDRAYPDSSAIDRQVHSLEADYDQHNLEGGGLHIFHKTDRRLINDETARPSAWAHWTDFSGETAVGAGRVFLDLQNEIWQYDQDFSAYFDSWRIKGVGGYTWGDILSAVWRLGFAVETLQADDEVETYTQYGLRAGVESYGTAIGGSLTVEHGRRHYKNATIVFEGDETEDPLRIYSDFNYWELWLMANWTISDHFSLDLMASYEPESHTEQADDSIIGFSSLRLVWRP